MNIGILGLLPEQVRFVQQEFPNHALRFLEQDAIKTAPQFAKGCDKVVVLTKFIGHAIVDRIPARKKVVIHGGAQKLKAYLSAQPTPVKVIVPPKPIATEPTREGRARDYTNEVDYAPLLAAAVGDEVRIARPAKCTLASFAKRIEVKRSTFKKVHGVRTSVARIVDGFAVMKVLEIRTRETAPPESQTAPTNEIAPMQNEVTVQPLQGITGLPSLPDARSAAFWQSVFVETVKQWPGAPIEMCAARADEAVSAYRSRTMGIVSAGMQ